MGAASKIEWTDSTWNPIRGCTRVSEGCRNCYAESAAYRFSGPGLPYEGLAVLSNGHASWTGAIKFVEEHLLDPLKWKPVVAHHPGCKFGWEHSNKHCGCPTRPRRIFVNSMSDLFHENVTDEMRDKIFAVMALCPQHVFQILTKRPERMLEYLERCCGRLADLIIKMRRERGDQSVVVPLPQVTPGRAWWPLANVQLGVSVENQPTADHRIPLLLQTPAAVRFISAEPLLGPIMLPRQVYLPRQLHGDFPIGHDTIADMGKHLAFSNPHGALSVIARNGKRLGVKPSECEYVGLGLDWVICGGESGPHAREMKPDWARSLRDQCTAAGVPFFFKQWGEWLPAMTDGAVTEKDGHVLNCTDEPVRVGKHAAGSLLDGVEWKQFPEAR